MYSDDNYEDPQKPLEYPPLPPEEETEVLVKKGGHPNRRARAAVLGALYALDKDAAPLTFIEEDAIRRYGLTEESGQVAFYRALLHAVVDTRLFLDGELQSVLANWELPRVAEVERLLLRMGAAEMTLIRQLDLPIIINETVELAKMYGEANSGKFVNGVLDALAGKYGGGRSR